GIGLLLTRSITKPIETAVGAAGRIAKGELSDKLTVGSKDETGRMIAAMQEMIGSLREMAHTAEGNASGDRTIDVNPASADDVLGNAFLKMIEKLSLTIGGIRESATALSGAATQISTTSQSLAQGTSEQVAAVEETKAQIEQIRASVKHNAGNARQM